MPRGNMPRQPSRSGRHEGARREQPLRPKLSKPASFKKEIRTATESLRQPRLRL